MSIRFWKNKRTSPEVADSTFMPAPGIGDKRFLHLIPDDKFINDARNIFVETAPGSHDFLVLSPGNRFRHIHGFTPYYCDITHALRPDFLRTLPDYEAVIIHYLSAQARLLVDKSPAETLFVWLGWGADYYHLICSPETLWLSATSALMSRLRRRNKVAQILLVMRNSLRVIRAILLRPARSMRRIALRFRLRQIDQGRPGEIELLSRISLFAPVLQEDYDAIKRINPGLHAKFAHWNYWTAGLETGALARTEQPHGQNILLGNSATPENNHMDTFDLIANAVAPERKIFCPLNYGIQGYREVIAQAGTERFGSQFVPLLNFMDTASYIEILKSCSIAAMNHIRQQAMGNILIMLWSGARVFLNHRSPVNSAMQRIGIKIHDIRALPDYLKQQEVAQSPEEIEDIRSRLAKRFGRNAILAFTRELLSEIADERSRIISTHSGKDS